MIHPLNVRIGNAYVDTIEIQRCGLVRVSGWSTADLPAFDLQADGIHVPLYASYRTERLDVRAARADLADHKAFLGFGVEYLLPWSVQTGSHRITLFIEGQSRFTDIAEVIQPHYDNLFTTCDVLGRDDIYGVGPPNPGIDVQALAIARMLKGPTLDFGCGSGALVRELRRAGNDAHGLEIDRDPIRDALSEDVRQHVTLYDGGFPIPFPDGAFHSIICCEVLEHIPDYRAALSEMVRVARGQVVLTVPEMTAIPTCFPNAVPWHLLEASHVNFFTQSSMRALLHAFFRRVDFARIAPCSINEATFYLRLVALCEK